MSYATKPREYAIASLLNLDKLEQLLRELVRYDNKLILLHSNNYHDLDNYHATALFKNGLDYYYYNPNYSQGEISSTELNTIAAAIFFTHGYDYNHRESLFSLILEIFSFDDSKQDYPDAQEVLARIDPALIDKNDSGMSILPLAAKWNCLESVRYFLNKNVPVDLPGANDKTALMTATESNAIEIIKILLKKNVNIDLMDNTGYTALMLATKHNHTEVVRLLCGTNANTNLTGNGWTALMEAVDNNNFAIIKTLLKYNANINWAYKGWTALMRATKHNNVEMVKLLLENNANIGLVNNSGWTALDMAIDNKNTEIVTAIKNHKTDL